MQKIIYFKLREDYEEYGYYDGLCGIFDSSYLTRSDDALLSYISGYTRGKKETLTIQII